MKYSKELRIAESGNTRRARRAADRLIDRVKRGRLDPEETDRLWRACVAIPGWRGRKLSAALAVAEQKWRNTQIEALRPGLARAQEEARGWNPEVEAAMLSDMGLLPKASAPLTPHTYVTDPPLRHLNGLTPAEPDPAQADLVPGPEDAFVAHVQAAAPETLAVEVHPAPGRRAKRTTVDVLDPAADEPAEE